jgi:transcriptional antiterminator RfaH
MLWNFAPDQPDAKFMESQLGPDERWFLVYTLPNKETRAQFYLTRQGFRTYLPQFRKSVRHARKVRIVCAPLFPRYLFIVLDLTIDPWLSVSGTIGVSSLFISNGRPVPVPEGVVETLVSAADDRGIVRLDDGLGPGQTVRILVGPFAEFIGILQRLDGPERARILLDIMGSAVPINLSRSALARVA